MNTLEQTYRILIESELARDGIDFSTEWAGKHQCWFAQKAVAHTSQNYQTT